MHDKSWCFISDGGGITAAGMSRIAFDWLMRSWCNGEIGVQTRAIINVSSSNGERRADSVHGGRR